MIIRTLLGEEDSLFQLSTLLYTVTKETELRELSIIKDFTLDTSSSKSVVESLKRIKSRLDNDKTVLWDGDHELATVYFKVENIEYILDMNTENPNRTVNEWFGTEKDENDINITEFLLSMVENYKILGSGKCHTH